MPAVASGVISTEAWKNLGSVWQQQGIAGTRNPRGSVWCKNIGLRAASGRPDNSRGARRSVYLTGLDSPAHIATHYDRFFTFPHSALLSLVRLINGRLSARARRIRDERKTRVRS